ncbi:unnamed protein product [Clonostachys byssicola]|uniref:Uncharacterized protein n=1 Tax=Clonostachys byssicola TaxID=160290 RepID=A0A9N9YBP8_9HYPO|nr:unnamed protein product [Clonostachys byssicola]
MAATSAMDVGENHILSTLSIHGESSDSEGEEIVAEDDLDSVYSEEGDEEGELDLAPNLTAERAVQKFRSEICSGNRAV